MKIEQIKNKLEDLYNNYIVNGTVFRGLFNLLRVNREKMLRNKMLVLIKKMKKLKELTKSLDNRILSIIESKLENKNFTEKEYLEHIYTLFNENMSDINDWKSKKKEIELKKKSDSLTKEDKDSLLILNKSIKLANNINNDLMSLFIEVSKEQKYSEYKYCKNEPVIKREQIVNKNRLLDKGIQIAH